MPAAGVVMIVAVVLIIAAIVVYLVLDDRRAAEDQHQPRRGDRRCRWDHREDGARRRCRRDDQPEPRCRSRPARGAARQEGRASTTPSASSTAFTQAPAPQGFRELPGQQDTSAAADLRGLHEGHAHARSAGSRGADRRGQPARSCVAQPCLRELPPHGPSIPGAARIARAAAALARDRHRFAACSTPKGATVQTPAAV